MSALTIANACRRRPSRFGTRRAPAAGVRLATSCVLLLASLASFANDANAPIDGAFGVRFGGVPPSDWIVDNQNSPLVVPEPTQPFTDREPPTRAGMPPTWHQFRVPRVPRMFVGHGLQVGIFARLGKHGEVVRILATTATPACPGLSVEVDAQLSQRYKRQSARGGVNVYAGDGDDDRITLGCTNGVLYVDYVDGARYRQWQTAQQAAVDAFDAATRVNLAEEFALGGHAGLEDALGVPWRKRLDFDGAAADVAFRFEPPRPLTTWPALRYELTLGQDRSLVRLEVPIVFANPALASRAFRDLRDAFVERFGPLVKDTSSHVVLTLSNDHIVARWTGNAVNVVLIDGTAYEAHRLRLTQQKQSAEDHQVRYQGALADGF